MAIRALTIDYSGTVVRENHEMMMNLCRRIAESSSRSLVPSDAAAALWEATHEGYLREYTQATFPDLRQLEEEALRQTLRALDAHADVKELMQTLHDASRPELFPDARAFFVQLPLPVLIVTNGDRAELENSLSMVQLSHIPLLCSEDVGAYKPRREIFEAALQMLNLPAEQVLHVGDSLVYDTAGAAACGMKTAWINRSRKPLSGSVRPDAVLPNLLELKKMMQR